MSRIITIGRSVGSKSYYVYGKYIKNAGKWRIHDLRVILRTTWDSDAYESDFACTPKKPPCVQAILDYCLVEGLTPFTSPIIVEPWNPHTERKGKMQARRIRLSENDQGIVLDVDEELLTIEVDDLTADSFETRLTLSLLNT